MSEVELIKNPYSFDTRDPAQMEQDKGATFTKAVIYARTSPRPQPTEQSLMKQIEDCRQKAFQERLEVIGQFRDDKCSGRSRKGRPELEAALHEVEKHKAVLIVYDLARLSRNATEALMMSEEIDDVGGALMTCSGPIVDTTNPFSKMVFRLGALMDEFFRENQGRLTREALAYRRSQGLVVGPIPYGWTKGPRGEAVPHAGRQRLLRWIMWRVSQGATYGWCAWELLARGYTRLDDGQISQMWVRRVHERWDGKIQAVPVELDWYDCLVNFLLHHDMCWGMVNYFNNPPPIVLHRSLVPDATGEWPHKLSGNSVPAMDAYGRLCLPVCDIRDMHEAIHKVQQFKTSSKRYREAMGKVVVPATENDVPKVLRTGFTWKPARFAPPLPSPKPQHL